MLILNMDRKHKVTEFIILGPSVARMALSRVAGQRMVGPSITTTTPESRSDEPQETVGERKGLNCCQVHMNPESICSLAHFSDFFLSGSFSSRQWQLPWTRREVYRQHLTVRTHAHFFSLHTPHEITRLAHKGLTLLCGSRKSFHRWSCLCWMFLRPRFRLSSHRLLQHQRHCVESD